jgi:hypothetical protein
MADVTKLRTTGDSANRVDIVFVAEGYTAAERAKFLADAQKFLDSMLENGNARLNAPFSLYKNLFNASAIFVASNQSGMDRPNENVTVDTYFDSSQHLADGRLLYGDENKVLNVVSNAVAGNAHELVIVLVNTAIYGGAGGSIAWASAGNAAASELVLHEIGHSYANLQDEYVDSASAPNFPVTSSDFLNSAHVTDSLNRIPWSAWLGYNDGELGTVGTYEGGYYRATGIWRATQDSKMLHLNKPFSAPEKEAFALQYYADIGDYLTVSSPVPGVYLANTPEADLFSYTWKVGTKVLSVNDGGMFDALAMGGYSVGATLSLTTIDNTGIIRKNINNTAQTENIKLALAPTIIKDVNYTVTQSQAILNFTGDNKNVITINDRQVAQKLYIDGGAGDDVLTLNFKLVGASNFVFNKLDGGSVLVSEQNNPLWALRSVENIRFQDYSINTQISANVAQLTSKQLNALIDLYLAYFNRIPDADGLNYWAGRYKDGMSLNDIGDSFFNAAIVYPSLTGYTQDMKTADFINNIYRNALGRKEGADAGGMEYWSNKLDSGTTKGAMVNFILNSAHNTKGEYAWVADLLDNKIAVANKFAVQWGLNFLTPEESISKGMLIAQSVTATDTSVAIGLIGIAEGQIVFV